MYFEKFEMQKQSDSLKWISINSSLKGPQLTVNSKVKEEVFKNLSKEKCNMISIFGAARQGKSFLMNCLAGQTGKYYIKYKTFIRKLKLF